VANSKHGSGARISLGTFPGKLKLPSWVNRPVSPPEFQIPLGLGGYHNWEPPGPGWPGAKGGRFFSRNPGNQPPFLGAGEHQLNRGLHPSPESCADTEISGDQQLSPQSPTTAQNSLPGARPFTGPQKMAVSGRGFLPHGGFSLTSRGETMTALLLSTPQGNKGCLPSQHARGLSPSPHCGPPGHSPHR